MSIQLRPITAQNWQACIALTVHDSQEEYVPSNVYSIAEAQFYPAARSRAIAHLDEVNLDEKIVGYALFGRDIVSGKWKIFRMMIDSQHQGEGHGTAAMQAIIAEINQEPDGNEILICYKTENVVARQLYTKFGFVEQSTDESSKVTAQLTL